MSTDLVLLQLFATRSGVSRWANALAALGWHNALNSTFSVLKSRPGEQQSTVQNRLETAVAHLFLQLGGHVKSASPNLSKINSKS
jgi:hypothetical protein